MNLSTGMELASDVRVALRLLARMKGLLGQSCLPAGRALWIRPCKSVHTIGMKFAIDVVFLDGGNRVVAALGNIRPNRLTSFYLKAAGALELPAGTIEATGTGTGDRIEIA